MAYIKKVKSGWHAQIERAGVRTSRTCATKAELMAWVAAEEAALVSASRGTFPNKTLSEAFRRYETEVCPKKRGGRAERLRFAALERDYPDLAGKVLHKITAADLVAWREARLKVVSQSSVLREAAQLRNVWTVAAKEWLWCGDPSPWRTVKLPAKAHARTRRTEWREVRALLRQLGYRTGVAPHRPSNEVAYAYLVAQHTAMRAGEIQGLTRSSVNLGKRVIRLDTHKTVEAEGTRLVPFTKKAARVLRVLDDAAKAANREAYFTVSSQSIDVLFRKARDSLMLSGMRFHDSRADALTRMSRKVDVMTLARISGHRDLRQLFQAYFRESAEQIADRL